MNFMGSECSSGCESGWTTYLEQSFLSANPSLKGKKEDGFAAAVVVEEEEEDLSMVSDASSGPPQYFYEDDNNNAGGYFNDDSQYPYIASKDATILNKKGSKTHKNKERHGRPRPVDNNYQQLPPLLDDTASSPDLINFSKNNFVHTNNGASMELSVFDYPQGFSATHFQEGPAFQDNFGFLQTSAPSGNHLQNNQWS